MQRAVIASTQVREITRLKQENELLARKMNITRLAQIDLVTTHQQAVADRVCFLLGKIFIMHPFFPARKKKLKLCVK